MNTASFLLAGALLTSGCGPVSQHFIQRNVGGPVVKGSGHVKTESRRVGSFSRVRSEGSVDVIVTIGGRSDLKVTADDNLLKSVQTRVEGDTLVVTCEGSFSTRNKMEVSFSAPTLKSADVHGSADISVSGLKASEFSTSIEGSGDVSATGTVNELMVEIVGSGDANLGKLSSRSASVTVTGSGDAKVNVYGRLEATINGSGDVIYYGNPQSVKKNVTGSGEVHPG